MAAAATAASIGIFFPVQNTLEECSSMLMLMTTTTTMLLLILSANPIQHKHELSKAPPSQKMMVEATSSKQNLFSKPLNFSNSKHFQPQTIESPFFHPSIYREIFIFQNQTPNFVLSLRSAKPRRFQSKTNDF